MAGNETDARKKAETAYNDAKKNDPQEKESGTKTLKTAYLAAVAKENSATGSSGQTKSWF